MENEKTLFRNLCTILDIVRANRVDRLSFFVRRFDSLRAYFEIFVSTLAQKAKCIKFQKRIFKVRNSSFRRLFASFHILY